MAANGGVEQDPQELGADLVKMELPTHTADITEKWPEEWKIAYEYYFDYYVSNIRPKRPNDPPIEEAQIIYQQKWMNGPEWNRREWIKFAKKQIEEKEQLAKQTSQQLSAEGAELLSYAKELTHSPIKTAQEMVGKSRTGRYLQLQQQNCVNDGGQWTVKRCNVPPQRPQVQEALERNARSSGLTKDKWKIVGRDVSGGETALEKLIRQGRPHSQLQPVPNETLAQPLFERFFMPHIVEEFRLSLSSDPDQLIDQEHVEIDFYADDELGDFSGVDEEQLPKKKLPVVRSVMLNKQQQQSLIHKDSLNAPSPAKLPKMEMPLPQLRQMPRVAPQKLNGFGRGIKPRPIFE